MSDLLKCGHVRNEGAARCGLCDSCWSCCKCKRISISAARSSLAKTVAQASTYRGAGIEEAHARYLRWWKGRLCRLAGHADEFRKVVDVELCGPPSFVYGSACLVFEDGRKLTIQTGKNSYIPRRRQPLIFFR